MQIGPPAVLLARRGDLIDARARAGLIESRVESHYVRGRAFPARPPGDDGIEKLKSRAPGLDGREGRFEFSAIVNGIFGV